MPDDAGNSYRRFFVLQIMVSMRVMAGVLLLFGILGPGGCSGTRPVAERPTNQPSEVDRWAAQLRSANWHRRVGAARKLGASRHVRAVALLTGAMTDSDKRVRLAVVGACGAHGSPKLIPALKMGLADGERAVRVHAVRALARIGTAKAVEALIDALDGASLWLQPVVADSLAALPAKTLASLEIAVKVLTAELDPGTPRRFRRLVRALAAIGEPALRGLILAVHQHPGDAAAKVDNPDAKCVRGPCRALVLLGKQILPRLMRLVTSDEKIFTGWRLMKTVEIILIHLGAPVVPHLQPLDGQKGRLGRLADKVLERLVGPRIHKVVLDGKSPYLGPRHALVTVVQWADYQCPYSKWAACIVRQLAKTYPKRVKIVYKHNPLGFHRRALPAAEAAYAAFAQKGNKGFWRMHYKLLPTQHCKPKMPHIRAWLRTLPTPAPPLDRARFIKLAAGLGLRVSRFKRDIDGHKHLARIKAEQAMTMKLRSPGTPTFFINGRKIRGIRPFARMKQIIDEEIAKAKQLVTDQKIPVSKVYQTLMASAPRRYQRKPKRQP